MAGYRIMLLIVSTVVGCSNSGNPVDTPAQDHENESGIPADAINANAADRRQLLDTDWFEEITESAGLSFSYRNGRESGRFTILESVGGGIGLIDVELDGTTEIFCVGGGTIDAVTAEADGLPCGLFRNSATKYKAITSLAEIPNNINYSHGCTVGDIDNDGFPDLFVTCYGRSRVLRNNGDGTFDSTAVESDATTSQWSTGAAFADVDSDGYLDLYVTGYLDWTPDPDEVCLNADGKPDTCSPQHYAGVPDSLFINSGDGQLHNIANQAALRKDGMGLGVVAADFDGDRKLDFYVANDVVANHFYLNQGGLKFTENAEQAGVGLNESGTPEGSMGVDTADFDGNGHLDLWVTNFEMEDNSIYRSLRTGGAFLHATSAVGLAGKGRRSVGFGTGFYDFDSDSWPDLYVLNGHVLYRGGQESFQQRPLLFRNVAGQRFEDVCSSGGPWFERTHAARGGAVGDINNDGALDLVVSLLNEPVAVLKNNQPTENYIRLRLVGTSSARSAVGTRVVVNSFGRDCLQVVRSGGGYLSHSDERLLFAIPSDESAVDARVVWPSGLEETFLNLQTGIDHVMIEGHGESQQN